MAERLVGMIVVLVVFMFVAASFVRLLEAIAWSTAILAVIIVVSRAIWRKL